MLSPNNVENQIIDSQIVNREVVVKGNTNIKSAGVGVFMCMITLVGTRLGAGVVGVPYATQQVGFPLAFSFEIAYPITAIFTLYLLLKVREMTGETSLTNIGYYWYGRIAIFFFNGLIALGQLAYAVIFFIVFGDVAGGLIEKVNTSGISFWSSRWFTHTILAVIMLYMVMKKEIQQLKYAGFALLTLILIFITLFLVHYLTSQNNPSSQSHFAKENIGVKTFAFLPTFATSYSIHPSFFTAFLAMKNKTTINGLKTAILAQVIFFWVYISTPLISFGLYGTGVKSNMLKSVASEDGVISVVLLMIFLWIAVIHIPLIFFFGKEWILIVFDEAVRRSYSKNKVTIEAKSTTEIKNNDEQPADIENAQNNNQQPSQENQDLPVLEEIVVANQERPQHNVGEADFNENEERNNSKTPHPKEYLNMKPLYYYIITITWFVLVVLLSIVVGDVSVFFGIIGATLAWFQVLVAPGSFYIITVHRKKISFTDTKSIILYILSWIVSTIGAAWMIGFCTCVILFNF